VSANPPTIVFSIGTRDNGRFKDTYYNILTHEEFVVNFVNEPVVEAMNITAGNYPPVVNEFERANLTPVDSHLISVPRVAESPIHFECKLNQMILIGDETTGNYLVIGTVVYLHVDDSIYMGNFKIDIEKYKPVGRLMGTGYTRVNDLFDLIRPPSEL
jgi:flavin reductase (DIM6/NTAB) family NADH-FMN oxidoreductase RutF